jgi:diguanylate cyclase (GGDEF)-like protein
VSVAALVRPRTSDNGANSADRMRTAGIAAVTTLCAVVAALLLADLRSAAPPAGAPLHLAWWVLAPMFVLAEVCVMHVHIRSDAHTVSLNEIPLVVGLAFCAPAELIVAQLAGACFALAVHRRQPLPKLGFNLASLTLSASAAVLVFRAVLGSESPVSPRGWLAGAAATETASVVSALLICAALTIARPGFTSGNALRIAGAAALSTAATTSIALVMVIVVWFQPVAIVMLALPVVVVFLGYRSYSAQHDHARDLEFLYDCARRLSQSGDVEHAIPELVTLAQAKFRAHLAELILLPAGGEEMAYRACAQGDRPADVMRPVDLSTADEAVLEMSAAYEGMLVRQGHRDRVLSRLLAGRGLKEALVVPLRGEMRLMGLLLVGNRTGDVNVFTAADLTLLAALADQASIALQNGRLERSLGRLLELERQLRAQAFHDPLTHLPNRVSILESLTRRHGASTTLLLVDIDGFGLLNEKLGTARADEVLAAVGGRLQSLAGPDGLVGRVSADEFAVLLDGAHGDLDAHDGIAQRIHRLMAHAVPVDGGVDVTVGVSVGLAVDDGSGAHGDLLARAMTALARAKRHGGGRTERAGMPAHDGDPPTGVRTLAFPGLQSLRAAAIQAEAS